MAETRPTKPLTPAQRGAAALDAAGANTEEVARALEISAGTLRSWRKNPLYQVAVDEIGRRSSADLAPVVNQVRNELAQGVLEAVKTLVDNLKASDEDGNPHYSSRQAAAATLLGHADLILEKVGRSGGGGGGGDAPAAQAVVQVTLSKDMLDEGSPFHVVDGEAEEERVEDAEVV